MITRTALIALALTVSSTPALAADSDAPASTTIRIDDLNLSSQQDQHRLETRLKSAARNVCRSGMRGLTAKAYEEACIADALAGAQPHAAHAIAQARGGTQLALLMVKVAR